MQLGGRGAEWRCPATRDEANIAGLPDAEASHKSSCTSPKLWMIVNSITLLLLAFRRPGNMCLWVNDSVDFGRAESITYGLNWKRVIGQVARESTGFVPSLAVVSSVFVRPRRRPSLKPKNTERRASLRRELSARATGEFSSGAESVAAPTRRPGARIEPVLMIRCGVSTARRFHRNTA